MKKILNKILKKNTEPISTRITTETVAQHREQILAGGRKFKYPIQYVKHKLVFNAIIISVIALIVVVLVGWLQLYKAQNTSQLMYRITKVIPVPVANIDGQNVLYSDYLMKYLSSVHYLENKEQTSLKTDDGKRQIEYIKQQSMEDVIADSYAIKMAKELNITVSDTELEGFLLEQRQSSDGEISEQTYNAVIMDYYGWSPEEYRHITKNKLLRQKVAFSVDKKAKEAADLIGESVKSDPNTDFTALAASASKSKSVEAVYNTSGWVPKTNQDGGLALAAYKLEKNSVSEVLKSTKGDGYYILRLLDKNDEQVKYEYVHVPLTTFASNLKDLIKNGKLHKYISVE